MARRSVKEQVTVAWEACGRFVEMWWFWVVVGLSLALVVGLLIYAGYWQPWSGFGGYLDSEGSWQYGKTLWDWMELLFVPLLVALGAALFTGAASKRERETEERRTQAEREAEERRAQSDRQIALDRSHEDALQVYLDRMTELIANGLSVSEPNDPRRSIARARTLTVLRELDGDRKGLLLRFLSESDLIQRQPTVALSGADLSRAVVSEASLSWANLSWADLSGANLSGADLFDANLTGVNLNKANLSQANLSEADLSGANLCEADLSGANLAKADLSGAEVTADQLAQVKSLQGATMPGGAVHPGPEPPSAPLGL